MDSEAELAAQIVQPELPKKRKAPHWCEIFKEVDLYGITPALIVGQKNKFKTLWGAFFSVLAIACFCSYCYLKAVFLI